MDKLIVPKTLDGASDDARVAYYREGFQTMMRRVRFLTVALFVLTAALVFYLESRVNRDRYFAQTAEGRMFQIVGLPSPNMGRDAISNWVAQSAAQVLTFGFNDVDERFTLSRENFSERGWQAFKKTMIKTNFLDRMDNNQQIMTAVPQSVPILKREGFINGVYGWTFDVPLMITVRAGSAKSSRIKTAKILVEEVPTRENPHGVGISEWYMY
jgi:hypothetical protein